jgi:hypothetical protein
MSDKDNSYADRLAALRLLRENILLQQPSKYSLTDIAEDLPGAARVVAPIFKNVLPSQAIISSDPEERKRQISEAVARIRATDKSSTGLGREVFNNVKNLGLGGFAAGTGIAALTKLLGVRGITKRLPSGRLRFQSPVSPLSAIRKLLKKPGAASAAGRDALHEGFMGAGLGAIHGAAVPLFAHSYRVSDAALDDAQKILQEQPQITGLPAAEMLSVLKHKSDGNSKLDIVKNTLLGAGLGLTGALTGAALPSTLKAVGHSAKNLIARRPLQEGLKAMLSSNLRRDLSNAAAWGTGVGALSGALTKRLAKDEQPAPSSHQT